MVVDSSLVQTSLGNEWKEHLDQLDWACFYPERTNIFVLGIPKSRSQRRNFIRHRGTNIIQPTIWEVVWESQYKSRNVFHFQCKINNSGLHIIRMLPGWATKKELCIDEKEPFQIGGKFQDRFEKGEKMLAICVHVQSKSVINKKNKLCLEIVFLNFILGLNYYIWIENDSKIKLPQAAQLDS